MRRLPDRRSRDILNSHETKKCFGRDSGNGEHAQPIARADKAHLKFVVSEARKAAAMIQATKRNLTTIYITHGHPAHSFGLYGMKQTFPNARIVALPAAINGVKNGWDARRTFWTPEFGSNLPPAGPILPEALEGNTLTLEGQQLQITGGVMGDAPNNSYVSIPSIKAVVAGDTVFAASHFTVPKNHDEWFKTLDQIAALKPAILVPGHQKMGAKDDLSAIAFMKKYASSSHPRCARMPLRRPNPASVPEPGPGTPDDRGCRRRLRSRQEVAAGQEPDCAIIGT